MGIFGPGSYVTVAALGRGRQHDASMHYMRCIDICLTHLSITTCTVLRGTPNAANAVAI